MTTVPRLLVVGDLVSDIRISPVEHMAPGEEVPGRISMSGGGSAANQAAWLARLGAVVAFAGRVGDDPMGSALVEELERAGVTVRAERDRHHPTGTVACLIGQDGERSLVTSRGANAHLEASDVDEGCWFKAEVLVLTGYCFTAPTSAPAGEALMASGRCRSPSTPLQPASSLPIRERPASGSRPPERSGCSPAQARHAPWPQQIPTTKPPRTCSAAITEWRSPAERRAAWWRAGSRPIP
jgi:ribokinase